MAEFKVSVAVNCSKHFTQVQSVSQEKLNAQTVSLADELTHDCKPTTYAPASVKALQFFTPAGSKRASCPAEQPGYSKYSRLTSSEASTFNEVQISEAVSATEMLWKITETLGSTERGRVVQALPLAVRNGILAAMQPYLTCSDADKSDARFFKEQAAHIKTKEQLQTVQVDLLIAKEEIEQISSENDQLRKNSLVAIGREKENKKEINVLQTELAAKDRKIAQLREQLAAAGKAPSQEPKVKYDVAMHEGSTVTQLAALYQEPTVKELIYYQFDEYNGDNAIRINQILAPEWETFASNYKLEQYKIENIKAGYSYNSCCGESDEDKARNMLLTLKKEGRLKWMLIFEAAANIETVRNNEKMQALARHKRVCFKPKK